MLRGLAVAAAISTFLLSVSDRRGGELGEPEFLRRGRSELPPLQPANGLQRLRSCTFDARCSHERGSRLAPGPCQAGSFFFLRRRLARVLLTDWMENNGG